MAMSHLVAYSSSIATGAALQQLTAIAEQSTPTRDNAVVVDVKHTALLFFAFGTTIDRLQWQAPSLRNKVSQLEHLPLARAMPGAGALVPMIYRPTDPIVLDQGEELAAFAAQSSGGAERETAFALLTTGDWKDIDTTGMISIRWTATTTLVANAWTNCAITLDQALAAGKYWVVGCRAKSAGALAWRIAHQDFANRPGGIATQSDLALDPPGTRRGALGPLVGFDALIPPTIDIWSTSADTAESGVLDIMRAP